MQLHTFKLDVYPGAILPFIIGYWADAATAVGDITATEEASGVETVGPEHDKRIQGCLLADGQPLHVILHTHTSFPCCNFKLGILQKCWPWYDILLGSM